MFIQHIFIKYPLHDSYYLRCQISNLQLKLVPINKLFLTFKIISFLVLSPPDFFLSYSQELTFYFLIKETEREFPNLSTTRSIKLYLQTCWHFSSLYNWGSVLYQQWLSRQYTFCILFSLTFPGTLLLWLSLSVSLIFFYWINKIPIIINDSYWIILISK